MSTASIKYHQLLLQWLHDRMPVILSDRAAMEAWLGAPLPATSLIQVCGPSTGSWALAASRGLFYVKRMFYPAILSALGQCLSDSVLELLHQVVGKHKDSGVNF